MISLHPTNIISGCIGIIQPLTKKPLCTSVCTSALSALKKRLYYTNANRFDLTSENSYRNFCSTSRVLTQAATSPERGGVVGWL